MLRLASQEKRQQLKAAADEVRMIVNETRQCQLALQIDDAGLRAREFLDVRATPAKPPSSEWTAASAKTCIARMNGWTRPRC